MKNSKDINDLHPALKRGYLELKKRMKELGYNIDCTQTYRDNEYQDFLYSQGRTEEGDIITYAKGGKSMHNYRLAFDICKNKVGHEFDDDEFFEIAGKIWKKMGGEWGGSWINFRDKPHMQFTNGASDTQIFNKSVVVPLNVKMEWELKQKKINKIGDEDYMITKLKVKKNGKEIITNNIFFENKNYVELRSYEESFGNKVSYNDKTKEIVIIQK